MSSRVAMGAEVMTRTHGANMKVLLLVFSKCDGYHRVATEDDAGAVKDGGSSVYVKYCDPNLSLEISHLQTSVPRGTLMML